MARHRTRIGWKFRHAYGVPCTWVEFCFPPFRYNTNDSAPEIEPDPYLGYPDEESTVRHAR